MRTTRKLIAPLIGDPARIQEEATFDFKEVAAELLLFDYRVESAFKSRQCQWELRQENSSLFKYSGTIATKGTRTLWRVNTLMGNKPSNLTRQRLPQIHQLSQLRHTRC